MDHATTTPANDAGLGATLASTAHLGEERTIRLGDLGIAPENPRAKEEADDGVPQLASTIHAAGVLIPLFVRPGRNGKEQPFMALDGRRRLLALASLVASGAATPDYAVRTLVVTTKEDQARALLLANSERAAIHPADVIAAIGRMLKGKMDVRAIARALGYDELEVRRFAKLSAAHPTVLRAFKAGRLDFNSVKLLARLADQKEAGEHAKRAMEGITFYAHQLETRQRGVTLDDVRFRIVGVDAYTAAGGRIESDLFGDFADRVIDPETLSGLWRDRIEPVVQACTAAGLVVFLASERTYAAPDGFEQPPYRHVYDLSDDQRAQLGTLRDFDHHAQLALQEPVGRSTEGDALRIELASSTLWADTIRNSPREIGAVVLYPGGPTGVMIQTYTKPYVAPPTDDDADDDSTTSREPGGRSSFEDVEVPEPDIDVEGVSHVLHEQYTDVGTRALMRDLADSPAAALTVVVATLFKQLALERQLYDGSSAMNVKATAYRCRGRDPIPALDGDVRDRLKARRATYLESGLRPIPWVVALPHGEKMALLAELTAVSLDLYEPKTTAIRKAARAEAAEIEELVQPDLAAHWTPDETFLDFHSKGKLLAMLEEMGGDVAQARTLKKADLAAYVAEQAAERRFVPRALSWPSIGMTGGDPMTASEVDDPIADADAGTTPPEPAEDVAPTLRVIQGGAAPVDPERSTTPFDREALAEAHQWTRDVSAFTSEPEPGSDQPTDETEAA